MVLLCMLSAKGGQSKASSGPAPRQRRALGDLSNAAPSGRAFGKDITNKPGGDAKKTVCACYCAVPQFMICVFSNNFLWWYERKGVMFVSAGLSNGVPPLLAQTKRPKSSSRKIVALHTTAMPGPSAVMTHKWNLEYCPPPSAPGV